MAMSGVDYSALRDSVSMTQALELLQFVPLGAGGDQPRGPCPVRRSSSAESRSLFVRPAGRHGFTGGASANQLDLWSKTHGLTLFQATIDLCNRLHAAVPWLGATSGEQSSPAQSEKRNP